MTTSDTATNGTQANDTPEGAPKNALPPEARNLLGTFLRQQLGISDEEIEKLLDNTTVGEDGSIKLSFAKLSVEEEKNEEDGTDSNEFNPLAFLSVAAEAGFYARFDGAQLGFTDGNGVQTPVLTYGPITFTAPASLLFWKRCNPDRITIKSFHLKESPGTLFLPHARDYQLPPAHSSTAKWAWILSFPCNTPPLSPPCSYDDRTHPASS